MCRIFRCFALFCTLSVASTFAGAAGIPDSGAESWAKGDYASAFADWSKRAAAGEKNAQFNLGAMYVSGKGVALNEEMAAQWFKKAALQGHPQAQFNYGETLRKGIGGPIDEKEAGLWFRKAADQGLATAQAYVGMGYELGDAGGVDLQQAQEWYEKSAAQGDDLGETFLADWLIRYKKTDKNAQGKAINLYERAARQGNSSAQSSLGRFHLYGMGVEKNPQRARQLLQEASQNGEMIALANLATLYLQGEGVPVHRPLAYTYFWIVKLISDNPKLNEKVAVDLEKIGLALTAEQKKAAQLLAGSWRIGQVLPNIEKQ